MTSKNEIIAEQRREIARLKVTENDLRQKLEARGQAGDCVSVPRELLEQFPEINPANYGDDEVMALNNWGIEVALLAQQGKAVES